jgi:hypothetical protein
MSSRCQATLWPTGMISTRCWGPPPARWSGSCSSPLVVSLIVMAPMASAALLGVMILACALVCIAYYGLVWRDAVRDGLAARIDLEDRVWYAVLPVIAYLAEAASGLMLTLRSEAAWMALAVSPGALLLIGIHNAWNITVWSITQRRE